MVGMVAIAAALVTLVLAATLGSSQLTGVAKSLALIETQVSHREVARHDLPAFERLGAPLLNATRRLALKISPSGASEGITRKLDIAGNPPRWTAERVLGAKGAGLLIGGLLGLIIGGPTLRGLLFAAGGAAIGLFLPDLLLYNAGIKRQDELRRGLADALDMLTVCVEAGQGFDGALLQVARAVDGPIAGEFARVLSEIQIGKSRGEAFSSLSQRTTVPEAKNFVSALVQADRLGLPIAGVLREQASQMRLVRRQRAEEKAQKVTVKILFPLLFCIFPALFIVIIGPGVIRMMGAFSGF
jgi:tight adherence protein C